MGHGGGPPMRMNRARRNYFLVFILCKIIYHITYKKSFNYIYEHVLMYMFLLRINQTRKGSIYNQGVPKQFESQSEGKNKAP